MKIVFIATNYNNSHYTVKMVDSIFKNINHELCVVIIDNASNEEDVKNLEAISTKDPRVNIVKLAANVGYFGGLNEGLKYARSKNPKFEWVVVGNNDLEFPNDFCDKIDKLSGKLNEYPVISPDVVTLDGLHQNPHVINGISITRRLIYKMYFTNYYSGLALYAIASWLGPVVRRSDMNHWKTAQNIEQGHGSCYVLSPKFFQFYNSLWCPTFMMSEEYFLSIQLKKNLQKIFYTPEISVLHHMHGALNAIPRRRRWEMEKNAYLISKRFN